MKKAKIFCALLATCLALVMTACSQKADLEQTVKKAKTMCPASLANDKEYVITNIAYYDKTVRIIVEVDEHNKATYSHEVNPAHMKMDKNNNFSKNAVLRLLQENETGQQLLKAIVDNDAEMELQCKGMQTGESYKTTISNFEIKSAAKQ